MVGSYVLSEDETIYQLILLCLRGRHEEASLVSAQSLAAQPKLDWDRFVSLAGQERLSARLYTIVKGSGIVPPEIEKGLHENYLYEVRRSLFLQHELDAVLKILADASVEAIILKGAALSIELYRDTATRPMRDLDLLVRREKIPLACESLLGAGYSQDIESFSGATLQYENEMAFGKPGFGENYVELHWSLFDSPYYQRTLPLEWFWQSTRSIKIGTTPALILAPEPQLLHLCGHLALHHAHEAQLLWLSDVADLIRHYKTELDWDLVLRQAQNCRLVLSLRQVLTSASEQLGAPVPPALLTQLANLLPSSDEEKLFAWHTAAQRSVAQRIWSDIAHMPDWRGRIRYMLARLFPAPVYMMPRYQIRHWSLLPLYYIYHFLVGLYSALALLLRR
jgi:hypothetical protein